MINGGREAWNALPEEEKEKTRKEFREGRSSVKDRLGLKIEKGEENIKEMGTIKMSEEKSILGSVAGI